MLRELIGGAFIGMGMLTMVARVLARAAELQRRSLRPSATPSEFPHAR